MRFYNSINPFSGQLTNQLSGKINVNPAHIKNASNDALGSLASNTHSGLVGGAAAGGIMALLMGNKTSRNLASKVTGYGGATLLGDLSYKAYKNWQYKKQPMNVETTNNETPMVYDKDLIRKSAMTQDFEIKLIKVMIAAAKADGHIDSPEQRRVFHAIDHMNLSIEIRAALFNLLNKPIDIQAITCDVEGLNQKSELYLAAYLVTRSDHPENMLFMHKLATSLGLPEDLQKQLALQARHTLNEVN